jgi:hypothetical protein
MHDGVVQLYGHEASSIARLLESIARIWGCAFVPSVIFGFDTFHGQGCRSVVTVNSWSTKVPPACTMK